MMTTLRSLLVMVLFAGVVRAQGAQPPPAEMPAADVTKWLGFFDKLVETVIQTQTTCEKMAANVSSLVDANKAAVAMARKARAEGKKLPEAAQQHMLEGVKKMVPAMQKCGTHDKVRAAFAKLDLNRRV